MRRFRSLPLSIVLMAGVLATSAVYSAEPAKVASFTLPGLDGRKVKVDFSSAKVTLVNFWATWCLPCREEMPQIANLVRELGGSGLKAVGIAMESGEPSEVKAFLDRNPGFGLNYPMLMGDDKAADSFGGVAAVPTTYLVDAKGRIVKTYIGVTDDFKTKVGSDIQRILDPSSAPAGARSGSP